MSATREFDDFYWHDAVIHNIVIDRENPGVVDTVQLTISWPDEGKGQIIFEDVYFASLNLNFAVYGDECICSASVNNDDPELSRIINKLQGYNLGKLNCYYINTNSTNSDIKIIARGFRVEME